MITVFFLLGLAVAQQFAECPQGGIAACKDCDCADECCFEQCDRQNMDYDLTCQNNQIGACTCKPLGPTDMCYNQCYQGQGQPSCQCLEPCCAVECREFGGGQPTFQCNANDPDASQCSCGQGNPGNPNPNNPDPGFGDPGQGQPGDPGQGQPGDPGQGQPGNPGQGQPGNPGQGQPQGNGGPSGQNQPDQPGVAKGPVPQQQQPVPQQQQPVYASIACQNGMQAGQYIGSAQECMARQPLDCAQNACSCLDRDITCLTQAGCQSTHFRQLCDTKQCLCPSVAKPVVPGAQPGGGVVGDNTQTGPTGTSSPLVASVPLLVLANVLP